MAPFSISGGNETEVTTIASIANPNQVPVDVFSHVGTFSTSEVYGDFGKEVSSAAANRKNDDFVESIVGVSDNSGWGNSPTLPYSWSAEDIKPGEINYLEIFTYKFASMNYFFCYFPGLAKGK